ncbi:MAG: TonB-dependent receptor [Crocinitomicaceae bacterium]|nr:TonB-dependent receptor [Crocinitomicaceae bacterium]
MKLLKSLFAVLLLSQVAYSQDFTIRGFLTNAEDGEPMPFEKVKLLKADGSGSGGAITDVNGFYQIGKVSKGDYTLKVEAYSFEAQSKSISVTVAKGIKDVNFELKKQSDVIDIEEMSVSADSKRKTTQVLISEIRLDKKGLERIPSVGGENDIVSAFGVTPGVVTTGDQGGQIYVRGGTPIQNKILLDGMTIYNPFHSIGFFSIFETELVQNASIFTGGFDGQYGGRISSIMDITYRDGNKKKFGGKISASPFIAKAVLEGPLGSVKDGKDAIGSYVVSAKHSLIDYTSQSLYPRINENDTLNKGMPFNFTDLYGKLTFKGKGGSKFSAFGFHNRDRVNYTQADINWNQSGGGINFVLVPTSSPIFVKGHVNGSNFATQFNEPITGSNDTTSRFSSIGGFDLGFDFSLFLKNESQFNYGINLAGFNTKFETYNAAKQKIEATNFSTEIGVYFSYKYVTTRFVVQPSFRAQLYAALGTISPEPRLRIKFNANEKLRFKVSGGRFSQNFTSASSDKDVVNLFNGILSAPSNVQETFVTLFQNEKEPKNGLQYAWHAIGGFELDFTKKLSMNVEGYYKYFSQLSNINQNKKYPDDAANIQQPDIFKKDFILENGESFGADVLLKYSGKRLYLWGVYSIGKSTRWDGDTTYAPVFDRRHNVNLVGTYLFGKKKTLEVSVRWNFGSGLPFTPTAGFYESETFTGGITTDPTTTNGDNPAIIYGDFNSSRLPTYHRLDLTVKKKFILKNKMELEAVGSVTNLYDRKNIFYVNRATNETIYQFPILPSFGLSWKF